jgi:hypothetical protein
MQQAHLLPIRIDRLQQHHQQGIAMGIIWM